MVNNNYVVFVNVHDLIDFIHTIHRFTIHTVHMQVYMISKIETRFDGNFTSFAKQTYDLMAILHHSQNKLTI